MGTTTGNPTWEDYPSTTTPVTATALENIEAALDQHTLDIEAAGSLPISTVVLTTGSLANNAHQQMTATMTPSFAVGKVVTSVPARVRLYATEAQRTADLGRNAGSDPVGNHGLLLDLLTTTTALSFVIAPSAVGFG